MVKIKKYRISYQKRYNAELKVATIKASLDYQKHPLGKWVEIYSWFAYRDAEKERVLLVDTVPVTEKFLDFNDAYDAIKEIMGKYKYGRK